MTAWILDIGILNGKVIVTKDGSAKPDDGETIEPGRTAGDTVTWQADSNMVSSFEIDFVNALSPFESGGVHFHWDSNNPIPAQLIDPTRPNHNYKYTVTAVPVSGPHPRPRDPHIIVNDGDNVPPFADDLATAKSTGEATLQAVVEALAKHMNDTTADDGKRFFFPFGIQSISVDVTMGTAEVNVQVSGETVG